jgi:hypothetical protein
MGEDGVAWTGGDAVDCMARSFVGLVAGTSILPKERIFFLERKSPGVNGKVRDQEEDTPNGRA